MADSEQDRSADTGDLQFEHAEPGSAAAAGGTAAGSSASLECTSCNRAITDAYHEINGHTVCDACRRQVEQARSGGSAAVRVLRAALFGVVAGALGAGIYYGISALTGYEFGLIAILVGFMVGMAVKVGSEHRGGWLYQLLAVGLTYCAIVSTYVPLVYQGAVEGMDETSAETSAADGGEIEGAFEGEGSEPAEEAIPTPGTEVAAPEEDVMGSGLGKVLMWVLILGISFFAPILAGFENILGLLIIGFGLWEAWRLNRKQPLEISGPFQVGGGGSSQAQPLGA